MMALTTDLAIDRTAEIAQYIRAVFQARIRNQDGKVQSPKRWSLHFLIEVNHVIEVLVRAFSNKKHTEWRIGDYEARLIQKGTRCSGQNEKLEAELMAEFPPIKNALSREDRPLVITDADGRLLVWYLPGLLSPERQEFMWNSLEVIERRLKMKHGDGSWRMNEQQFSPQVGCKFRPGTLSMAPAWFQQGMQTKLDLEVSAELKTAEGLSWIETMQESSALVGAAMSVIHPELFDMGVEAIRRLNATGVVQKADTLPNILQHWSAPFSGLSLMNNRMTPAHRDNGGGYHWMDLLITVGRYRRGLLELPGLGIRVLYNAGTAVAVSGRVVRHAASAEGERLCIAYYMRENVVNKLGLGDPNWAHVGDIVVDSDN